MAPGRKKNTMFYIYIYPFLGTLLIQMIKKQPQEGILQTEEKGLAIALEILKSNVEKMMKKYVSC
jgi:hypothetical protein